MSNLLIVTWDRVRAAALLVQRDAVDRPIAAWEGQWPEGIGPQDPAAAGAWLRGQWTSAELAPAAPVWLVLPREDVILRHFELPDAPDEELPDLVRFQAASRSTVPLEQLHLDFIPLAPLPGHAGRDVLAATVTKGLVRGAAAVIAATERQVAGVSFTSLALGEWGEWQDQRRQKARGSEAANSTLVVGWDGQRVELSVVCGKELTFSHAARLAVIDGADPTPAVLAEISRTLIAGQRLRPGLKVDHGWVIGEHAGLAAALSDRLGCPIETLPPLADLSGVKGATSLTVAPVLAAILQGVRHPPITAGLNFLKPRQAPPKRDPRKRLYAVASAAVLLVSFLVGGTGQLWLRSLDRQIADLYSQSVELEDQVRAGQPLMTSAAVVKDWTSRDRNQLQQLVELERIMPGGVQRPYLSEYDFAVATTGEMVGKINGTGAARTRADVETLWQDLRQQYGYQVIPKEVTTSRDPDYSQQYRLDLSLPKQKPAPPPAASGPAAAPPAT